MGVGVGVVGAGAGAGRVLGATVGLGIGQGDVPDTASIPPTTSLVSLFESKKVEDGDPVKRRVSSRRATSLDMDAQVQAQRAQQQGQKLKPKPKPKPNLSTDISKAALSEGALVPSQRVSQKADVQGKGDDIESGGPASRTENGNAAMQR